MMPSDSRFSWIALAAVPGIGAVTYKTLISAFGHPEKVFAATGDALRAAGAGEKVVKAIAGFTPLPAISDELARADELGIDIVLLQDPGYPKRLREITDPPPYIYMKGALGEQDDAAVAVVGSRQATFYGREMAARLSRELVSRGVTVVSGMARGVDTSAHKGALEAGGRTVAVLGSGLDYASSREYATLMERIAASGAVISEYPLGTPPNPENFPRRNRIISGLSLGTLVVEATSDSGSLITAGCAVKQGRKVFAIPGNLTSTKSGGTNALIKAGAKMVTGVDDILRELRPFLKGATAAASLGGTGVMPAGLTAAEETVYNALSLEPCHIDRLSAETGMAVHQVSGILMAMELRGIVRQLPGKMFVAG